MLSANPGMPTGSLKPNFSAVATSLRAPTLAPSGAKTELHDSANDSTSVPPHDSPLAFCSRTPDRWVSVWTGKTVEGLAAPASRTAVSVIILNVEPGGCRSLAAIPARARIWPSGLTAAAPPSRSPSAATAAFWASGSIVVRTFWPARGVLRARTWRPARRMPPGVPASGSLSASSRPDVPTRASGG